VVESAQRGCYYLAHPKEHVRETDTTYEVDEKGVKERTYKFFDAAMKDHAEAFRGAKKIINMTEAHASLQGAVLVFRKGDAGGDLFFDADNPTLVRVGLWSVINTTIGVFDSYHLPPANSVAFGSRRTLRASSRPSWQCASGCMASCGARKRCG